MRWALIVLVCVGCDAGGPGVRGRGDGAAGSPGWPDEVESPVGCSGDPGAVIGRACDTEGALCSSGCDPCRGCREAACRAGRWIQRDVRPSPSCTNPPPPDGPPWLPPDPPRPPPDGPPWLPPDPPPPPPDGPPWLPPDGPPQTCSYTSGFSGGDLPGVTLALPGQDCVIPQWDLLNGSRAVHYEVRIERRLEGVMPTPYDDGGCARPNRSGLSVGVEVFGNGQRYCLCDLGMCPPPDQPITVTLEPGVYPMYFPWQGRNGTGPSDVGNPDRAPFPPGDYTILLSARGRRTGFGQFHIWTSFPLRIAWDLD